MKLRSKRQIVLCALLINLSIVTAQPCRSAEEKLDQHKRATLECRLCLTNDEIVVGSRFRPYFESVKLRIANEWNSPVHFVVPPVLGFVLHPDGTVSDVSIKSTCGRSDTDNQCVNSLSNMQFKPFPKSLRDYCGGEEIPLTVNMRTGTFENLGIMLTTKFTRRMAKLGMPIILHPQIPFDRLVLKGKRPRAGGI